MRHATVKHYVSIMGILALTILGAVYLVTTPDPRMTVVITFAAGIAGLGGYNLRQRDDITE